jgi:hypothetical protein
MYYDRVANTLFLINDAGSAWVSGTPNTSGTLQNSQCSIALSGTTVSVDTNTLTLDLALTFKPAFAGAQSIFMYAANATLNSGWQTRGTWTAP